MARIFQIAQLGHPVLRQIAEPVDDPFATSREANGAGIAAPPFALRFPAPTK